MVALTNPIRRGFVATMKADAGVTAIAQAKEIYPQTVKAKHGWPFVRMGPPSATPLRGACFDGLNGIVAVHGFAKDRMEGSKAVETAEDHAGRLGDAIKEALDGAVIDLPGGKARIKWTSGQLLEDPAEAGCFHTVQNFRVRALTA